jgi:hypothetical protein
MGVSRKRSFVRLVFRRLSCPQAVSYSHDWYNDTRFEMHPRFDRPSPDFDRTKSKARSAELLNKNMHPTMLRTKILMTRTRLRRCRTDRIAASIDVKVLYTSLYVDALSPTDPS